MGGVRGQDFNGEKERWGGDRGAQLFKEDVLT